MRHERRNPTDGRRAIRKVVAALTAVALLAGALTVAGTSAAGASGRSRSASATAKVKSVRGVAGGLTNFVGGSLAKWAGSKFMSALGIPTTQTAEFNQLEDQMTQLDTSVNTVIQQQQETLLTLDQMQDWMNQNQLTAASTSLGDLENLQQTDYNKFSSVMQNGTGGPWYTWQDIGSSSSLQADLASSLGCVPSTGTMYTCTNYTSALYTDTLDIVGNASPTPGGGIAITTPNFAATVFQSIQAVAMENPPTPGKAGGDLVPMAEENDETIMPYVTQIALLLQQDYNIMATLLYLKYCANNLNCASSPTPVASNLWADISLPYTGFNYSNSAQTNAANLNSQYASFFQALQAAATQYLISDNPGNPAAAGTYTNLKTYQGVNGGTWSNSCNLFVWSGASTTPGQGYTGAYDGQTLTTQCWDGSEPATATASITPSSVCDQTGSTLTAAFAPVAPSGEQAQLQCSGSGIQHGPWWGYSGTVQPGGSAGYKVDAGDPHGTYHFNLPSGMTQFPGTTSDPSPGSGWSGMNGDQGYVNTSYLINGPGSYRGVTFSVPYQWRAPNGYVGPFLVQGSGSVPGDSKDAQWTMSIGCASGDPLCSGGVANGVCLAGYPVTITSSSGSSDIGNVSVGPANSCTVADTLAAGSAKKAKKKKQ